MAPDEPKKGSGPFSEPKPCPFSRLEAEKGPDPFFRACDVAVIGGGLAGSALSIHLARAGRRVALFERERFPRDKLCGEFLSPESIALLRELECLTAVRACGPAPIRRARFTSVRGRVLELPLPGEGLGISRAALDEILFRRAEASGALVHEASTVRSVSERSRRGARWMELEIERRGRGMQPDRFSVTARCLVGAYGRASRIERALEGASVAPALRSTDRYVGLKKHHRPAASADGGRLRDALLHSVEIHSVPGGYCGLSFVEDDTVNVCMLLRKETVTALESTRWPHVRRFLQQQNPILARRLDGLVPTDRPLIAVGRVPTSPGEAASGGVLRVGDAAGMIAPLCGDGQAMALSSARLLATLFARVRGEIDTTQREDLERAWRWNWRRRYGARLLLGRWLQRVVLEPRLAHAALGVLASFPGLTGRLVRWTREK